MGGGCCYSCYVSKPSFSAAKNPRTWTRTNWGKVRGLGRELGIRNNTSHMSSDNDWLWLRGP